MQPRFGKFNDPEINKAAQLIALVFSNISKDNFKHVEVTGKTSSSANTSQLFRHGLNEIPSLVLIIEGNAYIARNGYGADSIDVRSNETNAEFRAMVIR